MISNGHVKAYSGQGRFVENLIVFIFVFGLLLASMVSIAFWTLDNVWIPGLGFMAAWTLSFLLAKEFVGRSDTLDKHDLHGDHGEPLDAMASRAAESRASISEPKAH